MFGGVFGFVYDWTCFTQTILLVLHLAKLHDIEVGVTEKPFSEKAVSSTYFVFYTLSSMVSVFFPIVIFMSVFQIDDLKALNENIQRCRLYWMIKNT